VTAHSVPLREEGARAEQHIRVSDADKAEQELIALGATVSQPNVRRASGLH
jgi:hypothetical protein